MGICCECIFGIKSVRVYCEKEFFIIWVHKLCLSTGGLRVAGHQLFSLIRVPEINKHAHTIAHIEGNIFFICIYAH